ncbi:DUF2254 family protein [Pseudomonas syringae]|uniref:DUF2254 family protein n=1 Tax=Pseudomonas syringae TaxID=317 RepID=UPI003D695174
MLAVTTFSLSTMVTAYGAASSGVTPRATTLVMEDTTTQNALATFIGSFLFSLVGIIALSTGVYGAQGRVLLFAATIVVVILIVYTLLRWIDHLSKLGRMGETIDLVEKAAIDAIDHRVRCHTWAESLSQRGGLCLSALRSLPVNRLDMYSISMFRH